MIERAQSLWAELTDQVLHSETVSNSPSRSTEGGSEANIAAGLELQS
jgi:hypothetical protein